MNFISPWQQLSSDLQALPPGHSLELGTLVCQFKITFMQMYPNLLHCNLAWVQWAVKVTWTAQAVRGDWASLQSVWGWLPTANVPARQFQTSRGNSTQPATLELTAALETPWAVKQSITDLQAAEVGTKQAGSSDWNWKCECSLAAAELPSAGLQRRAHPVCGAGKWEWPQGVRNSQGLGRHSVNTKPNDFLAHFYEPRKHCKDWMKRSSIPLNAQADVLPLRK